MDAPQENIMGNIGEARPVEQPQAKRKPQFSKFIVISMILLIIAYTVTVLWLSWQQKTVPDSLTVSVFAAITGEFGILGWIRVKGD